MTSSDAREALDSIADAQRAVTAEIGLPRGYWWAMAAGWIALGALGQYGPSWLTIAATVAFGAGHSALASRLLSGRNRTTQLQVAADIAGRRVAPTVVGMLLCFVALCVAVALLLDADHAAHPQMWAAGFVAAVVGFGGPEILRVLLRLGRA